ncbi:hypothetical protein FQR65_LT02419 [Abscondita terminalis]|nr:hypothetical protein FQR65_LT02419 [Abscondita terminalis]
MDRTLQNYGTMSSDNTDVHFEGGSNTSEFNSICDNIVTNIYTINSSWKTLESALKSLGTTRDTKGLRDKIHVTQLSTNQIISVTPKEINRLKMIITKGDKPKEFQVRNLTENFKVAMAKYHSMQKEVANKMKANLLPPTTPDQSVENNDVQQQQQIQLSRELAFEQDLLVDRESRIMQIEADILDVNQIMRELSALVHEQKEHVDTIENSIETAATHVEEGADQLLKASRYQTRYRRKLCILVIIVRILFLHYALIVVMAPMGSVARSGVDEWAAERRDRLLPCGVLSGLRFVGDGGSGVNSGGTGERHRKARPPWWGIVVACAPVWSSCARNISTIEMNSHKLQPFTCYFCNKVINNDTEYGHISNCGSVLEPCVNKCGSYVPRNMRTRHLKECKNKMSKSLTKLSFDGDDYNRDSKDLYTRYYDTVNSSHTNSLPKSELSKVLNKFHGVEQLCHQLNQTVSVIQTRQQDIATSQNNLKMQFKMQFDKLQYQIQIFFESKKSLETQLDNLKHEIKLFGKFQDETVDAVDKLKGLHQITQNIEILMVTLKKDFESQQNNNVELIRQTHKELSEFKDFYAQENAVIGALWNDYKTDVDKLKYDLSVINKTLDENKTKTASIVFDLRTASQISAETSDKLEIQERSLNALKNEVAQLKLDIENLNERNFDGINANDFSGRILWKITNFSQKMEKAKESDTVLRSFIFYTHRFGYKIRVHIFLNGIKKWKGRHMIACLHVLKGEYDLLLKWPCYIEGTLTIKDLYNHANPGNFTKYICAKRYLGDEENEEPQESSTQYMFVPHSTLMKQHFVRDDTLFIEIKIKSTKKSRDETDL